MSHGRAFLIGGEMTAIRAIIEDVPNRKRFIDRAGTNVEADCSLCYDSRRF